MTSSYFPRVMGPTTSWSFCLWKQNSATALYCLYPTFTAPQKHASLQREALCQDSSLTGLGDQNLDCHHRPLSLSAWTEMVTVHPPSLVPSLDWVSSLWHHRTHLLLIYWISSFGKNWTESFYLKCFSDTSHTVCSSTLFSRIMFHHFISIYSWGRNLNLWICIYVLGWLLTKILSFKVFSFFPSKAQMSLLVLLTEAPLELFSQWCYLTLKYCFYRFKATQRDQSVYNCLH